MDINQDTKNNLNYEQWDKSSELERCMYVNMHQDYIKQGIVPIEPDFSIIEDNKYEIIKTYFKHEQWSKLSEFEKLRYKNAYNLYQESLLQGIVLPKPNFMISNEENVCENKIKVEDTTLTVHALRYNTCKEELEFLAGSGVLVHILDNNVQKGTKDRARKTLPTNLLKIKNSTIYGGGVFALKTISEGIKFGPYEGMENIQSAIGHAWRIIDEKLVNSVEIEFSNWMRYINRTRNVDERNLISFQYGGCLYYRSIKAIEEGEELLVFYEEEFMEIVNGKKYFIPVVENVMENIYACSLCCLGFSSEDYLKKHVSVCPHKLYVFIGGFDQCSFCKVHFIDMVYLENHVKYCRKSFTRNSKRLDDGLIEKDACDTDKGIERSAIEYQTNKNGDLEGHIEDTIYGKELTQKRNVKVHLRKYTSGVERTFQCSRCLYQTNHRESFKKHVGRHDGLRPFQCVVCNKNFPHKKYLKLHFRIHSNERPFQCAICNKKFTRKGILKRHLQMHSGEMPFECKICNKKFAVKMSLKEHLRIHTGERPFQCTICNQKFARSSSLKTHLETHGDEKQYQCNDCQFSCSAKQNLIYHIKSKHAAEKEFHCTICSYKCVTKCHLKLHLRTHTKERPFQCDICNQSFTQKRYLRRHLLRHAGERQFHCTVCYEEFSTKSDLETHLKTHAVEKPFYCTVCNKKLAVKGNLETHLRIHSYISLFNL